MLPDYAIHCDCGANDGKGKGDHHVKCMAHCATNELESGPVEDWVTVDLNGESDAE